MSTDETEEHRKAPRRSGREMRGGDDRRREGEESWAYYEKRARKIRRGGADRRDRDDRRHPDEKDG